MQRTTRLYFRYRKSPVANLSPVASANVSSCPRSTAQSGHTLEMLSVLQVVGLDKSATDIGATPSVQALP